MNEAQSTPVQPVVEAASALSLLNEISVMWHADRIAVSSWAGSSDTSAAFDKIMERVEAFTLPSRIADARPVPPEGQERMNQLEHIVLAGAADLAKLHAEFGFPESQSINTEDMIRALGEMKAAFYVNMIRGYPHKSGEEISNEIAALLGGRLAAPRLSLPVEAGEVSDEEICAVARDHLTGDFFNDQMCKFVRAILALAGERG